MRSTKYASIARGPAKVEAERHSSAGRRAILLRGKRGLGKSVMCDRAFCVRCGSSDTSGERGAALCRMPEGGRITAGILTALDFGRHFP